MLHADLFGNGDLNVINIIPIPERLKDRVGKTRDQNILHSLFAEIMVNTIDLVFVERLMDLFVQTAGRGKVCAERFFDDDAPPAVIFSELIGETEQVDDVWKNSGRSRHIVNAIAR